MACRVVPLTAVSGSVHVSLSVYPSRVCGLAAGHHVDADASSRTLPHDCHGLTDQSVLVDTGIERLHDRCNVVPCAALSRSTNFTLTHPCATPFFTWWWYFFCVKSPTFLHVSVHYRFPALSLHLSR